MALFGRKKPADGEESVDAGAPAADAPAADAPRFEAEPDKAAKFFAHARTVHEATNYEYAMQSWLNGLRWDPTSMSGLESFFASAAALRAENKKVSRDTRNLFGGRGDLDRYLAALLQWGMDPLNASLGVRAAETAAALDLAEPAYWLAERAMGAVARDKRPRKDHYVKLLEIFAKIGAFERAVQAGEAAVQLDPADGKLADDIRNLAAQATMSRGGFDTTGEEGGFRRNIRDADRQRQLEEAERIVKTEETIDRLVRAAEEDWRRRPEDPHAINVYAKRLLERGRPEDEKRAKALYTDAHERTKDFRFRQLAGDIVLRLARRKLGEYRDAAEASPNDPRAQDNFRRAERKLLELEADEFKLRVEAYPTDLGLAHELGKRLFELGKMDECIALFQRSKGDARVRVEALHHLGRAFARINYLDEAIEILRQALDAHPSEDDRRSLDIRYDLLLAMQTKAETDRELDVAQEADRLASAIAIQQFDYRDVRDRREQLKKLIADLKQGDAA